MEVVQMRRTPGNVGKRPDSQEMTPVLYGKSISTSIIESRAKAGGIIQL